MTATGILNGKAWVKKDFVEDLDQMMTVTLGAGNLNMIKNSIIEMFNMLSRNMTASAEASSLFLEEIEVIYGGYSFAEIYKSSIALVGKLTEINGRNVYKGSSGIIKHTVEYINENYGSDVTLASTAEYVHINSSYLSSLFKKEMSRTFSQYLTQIRLYNSVKLLRETHVSITDIALMCGFSNQCYFIKIFKENYRITPSAYRK